PPVMPRAAALGLDLPAVAFGLLLAGLSPAVFSLVPALQLSRTDLRDSLSAGGRSLQPALRVRTRSALVIGQLALALVLLVASSLLVRSFARLLDVDPGFDATNGLVVSLRLPNERYSKPEQRVEFQRRLLARLATLPGVTAVGLTQSLPMVSDYVTGLEFEGRPPFGPADEPTTNFYAVSPGFFDAMGIRLLRGRGIEDRDRVAASRVVVINESLARRYFPGVDPIGQRLKVKGESPDLCEIVGIVADTKQYGLDAETTAQVYESFQQDTFSGVDVVIRGAVDTSALGGPIRAAVHGLDPDQPVGRIIPIEQLLDPSLGPPRFSLALVGTFAGMGLLLAAVSLYGLVAFTVRQRTVEIGVRMALGARPGDVLRLVIGQALILALAGVGLGSVSAYGAARMMRALLFETSPGDGATFVVMPLALLAVVMLASALPARRAARVDPAVALRGD
ncbi:MAG: ABC transporter permease, partial [Acidobacteriota bacterium]|nr:ABC transporter permease [Acidobacteriota bacterium]